MRTNPERVGVDEDCPPFAPLAVGPALRVRPKTDAHDMDVVVARSRRFLAAGNKVRILVWYRGREHAHHDLGAVQLNAIAEAVAEVGVIERPPEMEGRNMTMLLRPS